MLDTKRELEFIGCAQSAKFLSEKVALAADRGYGVLIEPIGGENNRAFNLYQVTPTLAKAAAKLYEACKEQHNAIDILFAMLIVRDNTFLPSKSGRPWAATLQGNKAMAAAEPPLESKEVKIGSNS